jgi:hypothetical protein
MIITNTQLHAATPAQVNTTSRTPRMCLNDLEEALDQCTHPEAYAELEEAYWEVYREVYGEEESEDIFTDAELDAMQDDLFVPNDQRHLDRLSFLAVNELFKLPIHDGGARSLLEPELYDIIHSTLRMENALDLIDIWN